MAIERLRSVSRRSRVTFRAEWLPVAGLRSGSGIGAGIGAESPDWTFLNFGSIFIETGAIQMNYLYRTSLALTLVLTPTSVLADEFFAVTPSGAAEVLFPDLPEIVVGALTSKCIDVRWTVISSSPTEVVCEAPMNFGQTLLGQLAMGNSYSTPPRRFFRFNLAKLNGISRVQASGWMELQMAFGQMRRTDFTGPEFHNSILGFLSAAGGKLPVGTTFPNHVLMGVDGALSMNGKEGGFDVTKIFPDMPAAKGGVAVGDRIVKIAGKRFKSDDDYLDATAKAARSPTYEIEAIRAGKVIKLKMERAFRPSYTEETVPNTQPSSVAAVSSAPVSIADELAKLAKLKSDGILSEEEFQSQKLKLLAR